MTMTKSLSLVNSLIKLLEIIKDKKIMHKHSPTTTNLSTESTTSKLSQTIFIPDMKKLPTWADNPVSTIILPEKYPSLLKNSEKAKLIPVYVK